MIIECLIGFVFFVVLRITAWTLEGKFDWITKLYWPLNILAIIFAALTGIAIVLKLIQAIKNVKAKTQQAAVSSARQKTSRR